MIKEALSVKIKRFFNNPIYMHHFYLGLLTLAIILFGFFGIVPLVSVTFQKAVLLRDMREVNLKLAEKNEKLTSLYDSMSTDYFIISNFNKIISAEFNSHKYLVDFFASAGASGFDVLSFKKEDNEDKGETKITAEVKGEGDISDFIDRIENLKKTTEVENISYSIGSDSPRITLELKVYNWTKK